MRRHRARDGRPGRGREDEQDHGAAVVEFVLVTGLLLLLLLAVLQVAVYYYVRTVVAASAADAARYAAAEGVDPRLGAARAAELVHAGLDSADAAAMRCTATTGRDAASGLALVTVHCTGRVRVLFSPIALPLAIDVHSSVIREGVR